MDNKTCIYSDGTEYNGEWKDNKRHGYGVWVRPDGTRYEGEWENDKPNGQGTLTLPKGKKRSGLWENGKFIEEQLPVEHKGDNITKSLGRTEEQPPPVINKGINGDLPYVKNATIAIYGGTYTGELLNNKPHGQGIFTHSDGNEYIGSWRDGKPNGKGKIAYSSGELYEGDFRDGKRNGLGKYCSSDGRQLAGEWANGEFLRPIVITPEIKEDQQEKYAERNRDVQLEQGFNSDNEKGSDFVTASPISKSNSVSSKKTPLSAEIVTTLLWRCPICNEEESLKPEARENTIKCESCEAKWVEVCEEAMVMVDGPNEMIGEKSMQDWAELTHCDEITISANSEIRTSILLKKSEFPVKQAVSASLFQEKTSKVRTSSGKYGGVSVPLFRTKSGPIRFHTGLFRTPATYETNTEIQLVDEGEFLLTNNRIIFNGRSKPVNMLLKNIISVELAEGLVKIHYGKNTHFFTFGEESIVKWLTYLKIVCQEYGG